MKLGICTSVTMPPVVMPNLGIPEYYSTAAPHGETDAAARWLVNRKSIYE